jgi:hypothetical protein
VRCGRKKGQFKTGKLGAPRATTTEIWNAALAAWARSQPLHETDLTESHGRLQFAPKPNYPTPYGSDESACSVSKAERSFLTTSNAAFKSEWRMLDAI